MLRSRQSRRKWLTLWRNFLLHRRPDRPSGGSSQGCAGFQRRPGTCGYPTPSACFPCKPFCKQSFPCAEMEGNPRALSYLGCKDVAVQQYSANCREAATSAPRISPSGKCEPAFHRAGQRFEVRLAPELGDAVSKTRYFAAGRVAMNDVFLCRAHNHRLGFSERRQRLATVSRRNRFLDASHKAAHAGAARLIDLGAARDRARCLAGGTGVGHALSSSSVTACGACRLLRSMQWVAGVSLSSREGL